MISSPTSYYIASHFRRAPVLFVFVFLYIIISCKNELVVTKPLGCGFSFRQSLRFTACSSSPHKCFAFSGAPVLFVFVFLYIIISCKNEQNERLFTIKWQTKKDPRTKSEGLKTDIYYSIILAFTKSKLFLIDASESISKLPSCSTTKYLTPCASA